MPRGKRRPVVLHVEDDTPTQHRRSDILRDAGWFVSRVRTVQEALNAVSKKRPDVILCDVKLPDGTGFQICREMLNARPPVPVILISDLYRNSPRIRVECSSEPPVPGGTRHTGAASSCSYAADRLSA